MKVSSAIIKPLHRDESGASYLWQCLDNNNRAVGDVKTGTARQIGQYLNGKAGILLFDASDVVDSRVKVSQKQQKQLSQLLAFEIEPQLASDITQLHIAGHVVAGEDVEITVDEMVEHCRSSLAGFKTPKLIEYVAALPRNPSGKILKKELRASIVPKYQGETA